VGSFTFEYPYLLALFFVFAICAKFCRAKKEALIFSNIKGFLKKTKKRSLLIPFLKWSAILLACISIASPVIEDSLQKEESQGYSIALLLDASASMRYGFSKFDINSKSRFDVSMELAKEFVDKRKNDSLALVVFGDFAYVGAPLTYDKEILKQIMKTLHIGIAGVNYTKIYEALFQSAKLFSKSKSKNKIAILLTDGQSNADNIPLEAALKILKTYDIKVYTIGIGDKGDFDKAVLSKIAKETGGEFFAAYDKQMLKKVYEKIDKLEKSKIQSDRFVKKSYYYKYPLFIAVLFLLFFVYLTNRR
jgi:Ca-activated chloride channel family protein